MVDNTIKKPKTELPIDGDTNPSTEVNHQGISNAPVDSSQLDMAIKSKFAGAEINESTQPNNIEEPSNEEDEAAVLRKQRLLRELNAYLLNDGEMKDRTNLFGASKGVTDVSLANGNKLQIMQLGEGVEFIGKEKPGFFSRFSDQMPIDDAIATVLMAESRNFKQINLHGNESDRTNLWVAAQLKGIEVSSGHPADMPKAIQKLQQVMQDKGINEIEFKTNELKAIEKSMQSEEPDAGLTPRTADLQAAATDFRDSKSDVIGNAPANSNIDSNIVNSQTPAEAGSDNNTKAIANNDNTNSLGLVLASKIALNNQKIENGSIDLKDAEEQQQLKALKAIIEERMTSTSSGPLTINQSAAITKMVNEGNYKEALELSSVVSPITSTITKETTATNPASGNNHATTNDRSAEISSRITESVTKTNDFIGVIANKIQELESKAQKDPASKQDLADLNNLRELNTVLQDKLAAEKSNITPSMIQTIENRFGDRNYEGALNRAKGLRRNPKHVVSRQPGERANNFNRPSPTRVEDMMAKNSKTISEANHFIVIVRQKIQGIENLIKNNVASEQEKSDLKSLRELNTVLQDKLNAKTVDITPEQFKHVEESFSKGNYGSSLTEARKSYEPSVSSDPNAKGPYDERMRNQTPKIDNDLNKGPSK